MRTIATGREGVKVGITPYTVHTTTCVQIGVVSGPFARTGVWVGEIDVGGGQASFVLPFDHLNDVVGRRELR